MKPLRLLQRRIIATNLFFVLILLLGILTALFLNARARSMKEAGRYLAAELRFALQLGGIFLLAGFLIFGLSFFLARMSLRPVEHAFSEQQRFVQDASHELKTPLTVILANLSILKSRPAATIQEEMLWIQNTETEARRMQELTERLLFLAKADSKRLSPKIERLSLSQLTEAAALPFTALAFERGLTLDTEPEAGISVKGDARALTQLLAILIDNALKYARSGSVVTVRLARQKKHALLSVHNEGEVIPQDALPHLFDRFYRVDKSRARAQGGYGLGLSIAKTIAHAHGGDIRVESSAKHGTCFTTTLPLSE